MKLIRCTVHPFQLDEVVDALESFDISNLTVTGAGERCGSAGFVGAAADFDSFGCGLAFDSGLACGSAIGGVGVWPDGEVGPSGGPAAGPAAFHFRKALDIVRSPIASSRVTLP